MKIYFKKNLYISIISCSYIILHNMAESKQKSIGAEVCTLQYLPYLHVLELDYGRGEAKGCSIGPHNNQEHFKKLYVYGCSSTLKHDYFK